MGVNEALSLTVSINGDNSFCATSNNSPNSPQTTLAKNSDGVINLKAIISNAYGGIITIIKENSIVGSPLYAGMTTIFNSCLGGSTCGLSHQLTQLFCPSCCYRMDIAPNPVKE